MKKKKILSRTSGSSTTTNTADGSKSPHAGDSEDESECTDQSNHQVPPSGHSSEPPISPPEHAISISYPQPNQSSMPTPLPSASNTKHGGFYFSGGYLPCPRPIPSSMSSTSFGLLRELGTVYPPTTSEFCSISSNHFLPPQSNWFNPEVNAGSENSSPSMVGLLGSTSDPGSCLSQLGSPSKSHMSGIGRYGMPISNLFENPVDSNYQGSSLSAYLSQSAYPPTSAAFYVSGHTGGGETNGGRGGYNHNFSIAPPMLGGENEVPPFTYDGYTSAFIPPMQTGVQNSGT